MKDTPFAVAAGLWRKGKAGDFLKFEERSCNRPESTYQRNVKAGLKRLWKLIKKSEPGVLGNGG
jgi:hypothetical protein